MTESLDTVSVENQLAVLREIVSLLRRARIPYWVRGGWAVDFLIGRARPRHEDIDLVTWSRHAARLRRLLEDVSYQLAPTPQPVRQYDFVKNGVDVSFVFIRRDADGVIRSPGSPEWRWPDDALAHALVRSWESEPARSLLTCCWPRSLATRRLWGGRFARRTMKASGCCGRLSEMTYEPSATA